jgi:hypothetical protein
VAAFYEGVGFDVALYEGGGHAFVHYDDGSVFDLGVEQDLARDAVRLTRSRCNQVRIGRSTD